MITVPVHRDAHMRHQDKGVVHRGGPAAISCCIGETSHFRSQRLWRLRRPPISSMLVGAMMVLACVLACVLAGDAFATASVAKILGDMSYHDSQDLVEAGDRMKRDAIALGLDINEIQTDGLGASLGDTASGLLRVGIGIIAVDLSMRGRSYPERLLLETAADDTSRFVAILVATRGLSIAEMAELLQGGVRVLAMVQRNVFVLRAPVAALHRVNRMSYCGRVEEFTPAMKHLSTWNASQSGYDIYYFGSDHEHAMRLRDIADLGLEYRGGFPPMRGLAVRGPWERVQQLRNLFWVRFIAPYVPPTIED